jgi:hypothetical protein
MKDRRLRNDEKLKNLSKPIIGKRGDLSPLMRKIGDIVKEITMTEPTCDE